MPTKDIVDTLFSAGKFRKTLTTGAQQRPGLVDTSKGKVFHSVSLQPTKLAKACQPASGVTSDLPRKQNSLRFYPITVEPEDVKAADMS